jgi:hypothetical protein
VKATDVPEDDVSERPPPVDDVPAAPPTRPVPAFPLVEVDPSLMDEVTRNGMPFVSVPVPDQEQRR